MKYKFFFYPLAFSATLLLTYCSDASTTNKPSNANEKKMSVAEIDPPFLMVLGTVQDAGSPQIGCKKDCCKELLSKPDPDRMVVSLGLRGTRGNNYLFEASPDMPRQFALLNSMGETNDKSVPDGIFLTHAHIGHYTGLMYLGKEAIDAKSVPVYAMPRMEQFLKENGPWSLLVDRKNIEIQKIKSGESVQLDGIKVTPLVVPHRDEFSETVGYRIEGPKKSALFIPDIDKWSKWEQDIVSEIAKVDYAFLDATFYSGKEINNRDISQIPHPFVIESMNAFEKLPKEEKTKIHFIHFNHTNPILRSNSHEAKTVVKSGFNIAELSQKFSL